MVIRTQPFARAGRLLDCSAKLSSGGEVIDPLEEKPWGALFGVVQDRFGKVWMLNHLKEA